MADFVQSHGFPNEFINLDNVTWVEIRSLGAGNCRVIVYFVDGGFRDFSLDDLPCGSASQNMLNVLRALPNQQTAC